MSGVYFRDLTGYDGVEGRGTVKDSVSVSELGSLLLPVLGLAAALGRVA